MSHNNNSGSKDWITIITIIIMVTCVLVAVQFYYNYTNQLCIKDPLAYASNYYEDKFGHRFIGTGSFIRKGGPPIIIAFDSSGSTFHSLP
jgi:hypothetical protein